MPFRCSAIKLTSSGPKIWPTAKAAVIAAIRREAWSGARARASCMPAIVATTNVPPTQRAEITMPAMPGTSTGIATPIAITACDSAQMIRFGRCADNQPAISVETSAALPNIGQAQPNTAGSAMICFAMAGRKVPGMM